MTEQSKPVVAAPEAFHLMDCVHVLDPTTFEVVQTPADGLVVRCPEHGETTNVSVEPCFPVTDWGRFLVFTGEDGNELGVLEDIRELADDSQNAVARELNDQHLLPVITKVVAISHEFHIPIWEVVTDRGARTFTLNGRHAAQRMGSGRLYIRDAEGNGYVIPDVEELDIVSRRLIDTNV